MPVGIQIYDSSGNLIVDVGTKLARILGDYTISSSANATGTVVTDSRFSEGTGWFFSIPNSSQWGGFEPTLSFSGTSLNWSFPYPSTYKPETYVIYGVY